MEEVEGDEVGAESNVSAVKGKSIAHFPAAVFINLEAGLISILDLIIILQINL